MSDSDLVAEFILPQYGTKLRNIDGVIEQSWNHFGQTALLKKMIERMIDD